MAALGLFALVACGGNVFSLEVGTCFDEPSNDTEVSSVPIVECTEPHDREVYRLIDYTESDTFPGEDAINEWTAERCLESFDAFIGEPFATSAIDIGFYLPSPESWADGDRESICYVFEVDRSKMTGSVQGVNR